MIKQSTKNTKAAAAESEIIPHRDRRARMHPMTMLAILFVLAVIFFGAKAFWISPISQPTGDQASGNANTQSVDQLIARVGALAVTPNEVPTVATIQDIDTVRAQNQTLYSEAANGDKVLMWSNKVAVYSTSKDRLLVLMPFQMSAPTVDNGGASSTTSTTATTTAEIATVQVLNGTTTTGLAATMNNTLKTFGITTIAPTDAKKKNYTATVIFNASGKSLPQTLEKLVKLTGGTVVDSLPGEAKAKSDIVVIMGTK